MAPPREGPGTGVAPGKILASGESAEIADCVWMAIYPHNSRADVGKTVTPGPGSFVSSRASGRFGLFLDQAGSYVPIKLVRAGLVPDEVRKLGGAADDGIDGEDIPIGFRDGDAPPDGAREPATPPRTMVDLRRLAGEGGAAGASREEEVSGNMQFDLTARERRHPRRPQRTL